MRVSLAASIGLALLATACGGSSGGTTGSSGTSGGVGATSAAAGTTGTTAGASSTGAAGTGTGGGLGTSAGSTTTTTGGGLLSPGQPCSSDAACTSDLCDVNCCTGPTACSTSDLICGATGCDDTGTCSYPTSSTSCGTASCAGGMLTPAGSCDGTGTCSPGTPVSCGNYGCNAGGTACASTCASSSDCATNFVCNAGACVSAIAVGTCTENDDCSSGVCGLSGTGDCCATACSPTMDPACDPTSCDVASGACVYPAGAACGTSSCANNSLISSACDATGDCNPIIPTACPNNFACNSTGTACDTSCAATTDCAGGSFCVVDAGNCAAQIATGPCTENDACTTNICGIAGTGNCCTAACSTTDPTCGATNCDNTGACVYPDGGAACGTILASCTTGTEQPPSACNSGGTCNNAPPTVACTPYICDATSTSCLASCTDNTSCASGNFCDVANTTCCPAFGNPAVIAVDSVTGSDATVCCGIGTAGPCQTLTHAMALIDSAQQQQVTINATVNGAGGDWAPTGEVYPIALGWGAELSAAGVYFYDSANPANAEIFDVTFYSGNDLTGYASIAGTTASNVFVGMDSLGDQATDTSAIQVEDGNTLYIANATVNGSASSQTTAITVTAGGTMTLAQDQSGAVAGTVTIGNNQDDFPTDGYNGIVCAAANGLGCTISDTTLDAGSSVVIEGQEDMDIDAEDFASISLTSAPTIGIAPSAVGFNNCPGKPDVSATNTQAIWLDGDVTMTFNNGFVQCISGYGFYMNTSDAGNGSPVLTMSGSTLQNIGQFAVYGSAGTATISNSTIQYNANGVEEDSDANGDTAAIDLSGGGVGTNTVACTSTEESIFGPGGLGGDTPAVCVLNTTTNVMNASDVDWDTSAPDQFLCNPLTNPVCTCELTTACTNTAGDDDMDAVYEQNAGTITTTGNGQSNLNCAAECGPTNPCPAGQSCCRSLRRGGLSTCGDICAG